MQNNPGIKLAILLVSSVLVLTVSCQKKTVAVEKGAISTGQEEGYVAASTADASQVGEETLDTSVPGRASEPEVVMQEDIFFDFDKATLSAAAREILTKNGEWLRIESDVFITIEGHCDERGTNDYNLALGDRRAESVKTFLTDLGIDRSRMTTISYGEEHPSVPGHSESDWAKNRRAHFSIR